ncbi:MAG: FHA domain-containing protein [Proteobacteria bacterium]|nr:FHA domain-containing protein [Pseudomonadota bacterium]
MVASWEKLKPREIVSRVAASTLKEFAGTRGRDQLLLVRLADDPGGKVIAGLEATQGGVRASIVPTLHVLDYHTDLVNLQEPGEVRRLLRKAEPTDEQVLRKELESVPYFVTPLRKRLAGGTSSYMERISVGRARNMDIVLRDSSVSKFHAWFEVDEHGTFYIADAGSKNGTRIRDRVVEPREPTSLSPLDELRFGSVTTTICPAETFWRLLRNRAAGGDGTGLA